MLPVAILCGGKGTRVAVLTRGRMPKSLLPVAGAPFIDHQLHWLHASGAEDVVLLVGPGGDAIRAHVGDGAAFGLRVRYHDDGASARGTAGAVKDALRLLGNTFLTVYGDTFPLADPMPVGAALSAGDEGVMSVFFNADRWLPSNARIDGDRVAEYDKQALRGTMTHLDYGINAFRASGFDGVADDGLVDLAEVHRSMIERRTLRAFPVSERWYEIGTPEGLAETESFIQGRPAEGTSHA